MKPTFETLEDAISHYYADDPEYQGETGLMRAYQDEYVIEQFEEIKVSGGKTCWMKID